MEDSAEGGLSTRQFFVETIYLIQLPCFQVRCSLICCENGGPGLVDDCNEISFCMHICSRLCMDRVCVSKHWLWQRFYVIMFFCIYAFAVGDLARVSSIEAHCTRAYRLLFTTRILYWIPPFGLQPKVAVHLYFDYRQWESERVLVLLNHFAD